MTKSGGRCWLDKVENPDDCRSLYNETSKSTQDIVGWWEMREEKYHGVSWCGEWWKTYDATRESLGKYFNCKIVVCLSGHCLRWINFGIQNLSCQRWWWWWWYILNGVWKRKDTTKKGWYNRILCWRLPRKLYHE